MPKCDFLRGNDVVFQKKLAQGSLLEERKMVMKLFSGKTTHGSMYSPGTTNPRNHATPTWARGVTRSLFALVWDTSQLYKGCKHPGIRIVASWEIV